MLLIFIKEFRLKVINEAVNENAKRLHQVAAEIKMVKHIVVKYPELRQIAVGADLTVKSGQYKAVAVIQRGINGIVGAPCEIHAEKRIKIHLCGVSLTICGVEQLDIADI